MPDDTSLSALAARHDKPAPAALAGVPVADAAVIERLAALSPPEYDRCREAEAKALNIRVPTLDKLVAALRGDGESGTEARAGRSDSRPWSCGPIRWTVPNCSRFMSNAECARASERAFSDLRKVPAKGGGNIAPLGRRSCVGILCLTALR